MTKNESHRERGFDTAQHSMRFSTNPGQGLNWSELCRRSDSLLFAFRSNRAVAFNNYRSESKIENAFVFVEIG